MGRACTRPPMSPFAPPTEGQTLTGPLFNEPMRVETVTETGPGSWTLGLVGTRSERFRRVSLGATELAGLTVLDSGFRYDGDGALLRLGLQAHALGIAWEFDPYFGLSVSRVDPLPHQLEAVYDHLLKLARVRFLLADDAGAGKTIMAGLLIRELQLRGLAERILIVAPSNLAFQWQRELQEKFDETFMVLKGSELRTQFGVNQWMQQPKVVTSLDLAKREEILPGLQQVRWDLVVVDEAHRMSARDESHKSQRYKLGELLRDSSDHFLLLTATPHKGDPDNFSLFLQLLDRDAYADVRSIRQAMDAGRAPFYLRRTKEAMVHFPERSEDGQWTARKIFTKRIPGTVDFAIDGPEFELYREVTRFVKRQSARAAAAGDDPRARAVGFLMALYQRRLASSTRAMRRSLANRADRLERALEQAQDLAQTAPPVLPDLDELEEMEDRDRERLERLLDAITLAGNAEMVREEIFNFVATNTIEGHVLQRLLDKLQEIRDALDDDAVFNVVGEVLPAAHVERVLRDYYAGRLGDEDLEERLLRDVDEGHFRNICQNALEGLASKKLNLEMLVERRARARERRVVPETIARFLREAAPLVPLRLDFIERLPHTFEPARTPASLRRYEREADWRLPELAARYPRCSTDRDNAQKHSLEWVTPGHPLFEAIRRHARERALDPLALGATFHSLAHDGPARIDIYRARVVDGLGHVVHERVLALELAGDGEPRRSEPGVLGDLAPAPVPDVLPEVAHRPEPSAWFQEHVLEPFLEETRAERLAEVERVADHVELSLTELLQRTDEEIGRAAGDVEEGRQGAEGRLAMAEDRHAQLLARRERRREELQQQQALSLQGVERMTSVLVLPHPARRAAEVRRHQPDPATEATALRVVMDHERDQRRHVEDVSAKNLGYDVTSLDTASGDLRLIEVKGLAAATGTILLTPNERRVAEDRPDCYWLYVVTDCGQTPVLQEPIADPARFSWNEVRKVQHYYLSVDAIRRVLPTARNRRRSRPATDPLRYATRMSKHTTLATVVPNRRTRPERSWRKCRIGRDAV